jgi:hypothetical protein
MAALNVDKDEGRLGEERPGGNPLSFPQTFVKEQQVGAGAEVDKGERNLPEEKRQDTGSFLIPEVTHSAIWEVSGVEPRGRG